ncbi:MAG: hypothetical protein ABI184_04775, partial [Ginsengibacter sp.]
EVSNGWESKYEMAVPTREGNYKTDIASTLRYLELKKIKKLIVLNQEELEKNKEELKKKSAADKLMLLLQTNIHLKNMADQLTREIGIVIMK